jgi:SdrD B-like domain
MSMKKFGSLVTCTALCLGVLLGSQNSSEAQCLLNIPAYPGNTGNVTFNAYPANNAAFFVDTVNVGNAAIPAGTYSGWCIDVVDNIDVNATTGQLENGLTYNVLMYSSCLPAATLDSAIAAFGYPAADTNATQADWNAINYIINNPTLGGTITPDYFDIQNALWAFVGGPSPFTSSAQAVSQGYPAYNPANVAALVSAAANNPNYTPGCGGIIAVVMVTPANYLGNPSTLSQLTILQVPAPCVPTTTCVSITAVQGVPITPTNFVGSGGAGAPYTFVSTNLPAGLLLSTNGTLYGIPLVNGTFSYTVTVTDSAGNVGSINCSVTITPPCLTLTCPPPITLTNGNNPTIYCTFTPGDWNSPCNASGTTPTWWTTWYQTNTSKTCINSFTNWYTSCTGQNPGANIWNFCQNNSQSSGGYSGYGYGGNSGFGFFSFLQSFYTKNSAPSWCANFNTGNPSANWWVPCGGYNPGSVLNNCFTNVYTNGCVQIGSTNGFCATFTSFASIRQCLGFTGTPGSLNGNAVNPTTCKAGSFCAQVLALQLNCDFGNSSESTNFGGACGNLVYCDPTSPCNGFTVSGILQLANCALGGGNSPVGCTPAYLCNLCSNLNQSFEGCQVSPWCKSHLLCAGVPAPSTSGIATVTDACSTNVCLTYNDVVSAGSCTGSYIIARTWTASDVYATNTCEQIITLTAAPISGTIYNDCSGLGCSTSHYGYGYGYGYVSTPNFSGETGLQGIIVSLVSSNQIIDSTVTDQNGNYVFDNPGAGTYTIIVTPPTGYALTYPTTGTPNQTTIKITSCQSDTGLNFAYMGDVTSVTLVKTAPTNAQCGQTIAYCFAVTNTGNNCVTLTVNDPLLGGKIFTQASVSPGQGFVFTQNYTLNSANIGSLTNTATATVTPASGSSATSTSFAVTTVTTPTVTKSISCNFNSLCPTNGWLWCNANISCSPGQANDIHCSGAFIKITGKSGKVYTYPVPDCNVVFAKCTTGSSSFNGAQWTTTCPTSGDNQIFLSGCAIPWNPDFAGAQNVCWTGNFSSTTPTSFNWQWGAACYNGTAPSCGAVSVKPCHTVPCGYSSADQCGTPENCKPSCVAGGTGNGGSNCTGTWGTTGSCTVASCN